MLLLQSVTTSVLMNSKQFWETFMLQQAVSKDKQIQNLWQKIGEQHAVNTRSQTQTKLPILYFNTYM